MNKTIFGVIFIVVLLLLAGGAYLVSRDNSETAAPTVDTKPSTQPTPATGSAEEDQSFEQETFKNIKSAHFVSSDPANNALLTTATPKVTINFNFNLTTGSKISVIMGGNNVTTGSTQISADKLSVSRQINANKTGNYKVTYTACWPDGSCHDGSFGFSVELP